MFIIDLRNLLLINYRRWQQNLTLDKKKIKINNNNKSCIYKNANVYLTLLFNVTTVISSSVGFYC